MVVLQEHLPWRRMLLRGDREWPACSLDLATWRLLKALQCCAIGSCPGSGITCKETGSVQERRGGDSRPVR